MKLAHFQWHNCLYFNENYAVTENDENALFLVVQRETLMVDLR